MTDFAALARVLVLSWREKFSFEPVDSDEQKLIDAIASLGQYCATQARQEGIEAAARVANGYVGCDRVAQSIRSLAPSDPAPAEDPHMQAIAAGCYPLDDAPAHPVEPGEVERVARDNVVKMARRAIENFELEGGFALIQLRSAIRTLDAAALSVQEGGT